MFVPHNYMYATFKAFLRSSTNCFEISLYTRYRKHGTVGGPAQ